MPNNWILFLRDYAKKKNMTYSCALSDLKARDEYRALKATLSAKKQVKKKT